MLDYCDPAIIPLIARIPAAHRPISRLFLPEPKDVRLFGRVRDARRRWAGTDPERPDWRLALSSFGTNTWPEGFFNNTAAGTAIASTNAETSYLAGLNDQPTISPPTWSLPGVSRGRAISLYASGILSNTGTPTMTFFVRASTTQGSGTLSGTVLGQSAAITTASGVSNKVWSLEHHIICFTPGQGSGNCTLSCAGWVQSPSGFASPFIYPLTPGGGDSATLTATLDGSLTQFLNVSMTWSASSASNTSTLQNLRGIGWN